MESESNTEFVLVNSADSDEASAFMNIGRDYLMEIISSRSPEEREAYLQSMLSRQGEPDRWLILVKHLGEYLGMVHAKIDRQERLNWGYILEFYVVPSARRAGWGSRLFGHVVNLLRERDIEHVWLAADPSAEAFWRSVGFRETGESEGNSKMMVMEIDGEQET